MLSVFSCLEINAETKYGRLHGKVRRMVVLSLCKRVYFFTFCDSNAYVFYKCGILTP